MINRKEKRKEIMVKAIVIIDEKNLLRHKDREYVEGEEEEVGEGEEAGNWRSTLKKHKKEDSHWGPLF